jgi:hypothetical protein
MKAHDLLNLLHHIPGEVEVEGAVLKLKQKAVKAEIAFENLLAGEELHATGDPVTPARK